VADCSFPPRSLRATFGFEKIGGSGLEPVRDAGNSVGEKSERKPPCSLVHMHVPHPGIRYFSLASITLRALRRFDFCIPTERNQWLALDHPVPYRFSLSARVTSITVEVCQHKRTERRSCPHRLCDSNRVTTRIKSSVLVLYFLIKFLTRV